jgi:hypothetical protein
MTVDLMARLRAANPVPKLPAVDSPERLRRLIALPCTGEDDPTALEEGDAPALDLDDRDYGSLPANGGSRLRRRALVALPLCLTASVIGVVLSSGSSGPGVNVAAAAYAATSPRAGLVEAVFVTRVLRGREAGGTLRQREWNDSAADLRREQDSTTGPYGDARETHVLEIVDAPGRLEMWSSGHEAKTVTRIRERGEAKFDMAFDGISLGGIEGIKLYRQLYRRGAMRLVGRERDNGLSLWKLESHPAYADANGKKLSIEPYTRLVVLVDPNTFLPVAVRQIDIVLPGDPIVVESNLVSYQHYAGRQSEGRLFDLAAQHPSARVLTSTANPTRFVRLRERRHTTKRR